MKLKLLFSIFAMLVVSKIFSQMVEKVSEFKSDFKAEYFHFELDTAKFEYKFYYLKKDKNQAVKITTRIVDQNLNVTINENIIPIEEAAKNFKWIEYQGEKISKTKFEFTDDNDLTLEFNTYNFSYNWNSFNYDVKIKNEKKIKLKQPTIGENYWYYRRSDINYYIEEGKLKFIYFYAKTRNSGFDLIKINKEDFSMQIIPLYCISEPIIELFENNIFVEADRFEEYIPKGEDLKPIPIIYKLDLNFKIIKQLEGYSNMTLDRKNKKISVLKIDNFDIYKITFDLDFNQLNSEKLGSYILKKFDKKLNNKDKKVVKKENELKYFKQFENGNRLFYRKPTLYLTNANFIIIDTLVAVVDLSWPIKNWGNILIFGTSIKTNYIVKVSDTKFDFGTKFTDDDINKVFVVNPKVSGSKTISFIASESYLNYEMTPKGDLLIYAKFDAGAWQCAYLLQFSKEGKLLHSYNTKKYLGYFQKCFHTNQYAYWVVHSSPTKLSTYPKITKISLKEGIIYDFVELDKAISDIHPKLSFLPCLDSNKLIFVGVKGSTMKMAKVSFE